MIGQNVLGWLVRKKTGRRTISQRRGDKWKNQVKEYKLQVVASEDCRGFQERLDIQLRALKNQGRLKWIQKSNLLQVKELRFFEKKKKKLALFRNKTTEETDDRFCFLLVCLFVFNTNTPEDPSTGPLEITSKHPTTLNKACQTNTHVSYDEKNLTVLAAATTTWLALLFSCRSISVLSVLLQMSLCKVFQKLYKKK